jgi:O-glycosyl hydrolase
LPVQAQTGVFTLRSDVKKQTMIAVGFSNAFYTNYWHKAHPYSREIYNLMLGDLKPSMLRIRNHYGINAASNMTIDAEFLNIATQILGYKPTVLMSSWSPPANLKASGQLNGANANPNVPTTDVLAKDAKGKFRYADYAKYWVDSLKSYAAIGVRPDYFRWARAGILRPISYPSLL